MKETDYIKNWLKINLSDERYFHSLGTADAAKKLAKYYNLDSDKAYIAGLIHDCAKNMKNSELIDLIKNTIKTGYHECELKNPKVYHAIVAPYIAKKEFEIEDKEILNAIRKHTIGSTNMSLFEKIIFLADKIEQNTRKKEYTIPLYNILNQNQGPKGLDMAIYSCYRQTLKSLIDRNLYICPITIDVYNQLQESLEIM